MYHSVRGSATQGPSNTRPRRQNRNGNNIPGSVASNSAWANTQNTNGTNIRSPSNMSNNLRGNVERARMRLEVNRQQLTTLTARARQLDIALVHAEMTGSPTGGLRRRISRVTRLLRLARRRVIHGSRRHDELLNTLNSTRGPRRRFN